MPGFFETVDFLPMPYQNSPEIDFCWTDHIPDSNTSILATCHHHSILEIETKMEDSLAMMNESVDHLPSLHVPDPDGAVAGARDDDLVIVLETQH